MVRINIRILCLLLFLVASLFRVNAQKSGTGEKNNSQISQAVAFSGGAVSNNNLSPKEHYLEVNDVYFTSLDEALKNPDQVYKLRLSRRELSAVPVEISKFTNLVALDLSDNQITEVSSAVFSLSNLIELNLGNNKLTAIPSQICMLKNLESLALNGNKITGVGSELTCLSNLKKLFLQNNEITTVSSSIGSLKNLTNLYLFGNSISKIPDEISNLSQLQVLLLNNNKLKEPPSGLEKLKFLKYYSEDGQLLDTEVLQDVVIDQPNKGNLENYKKTTERKKVLDAYNHTGIYSKKAQSKAPQTSYNESNNYSSQANSGKKPNAGKVIKTIAIVYLGLGALVGIILFSGM